MALPYVLCPGCRVHHGGDLEVRTIERRGELYWCECGRSYPVLDGVPIVMMDASGYLRSELATVVEGDVPAEVAAHLIRGLSDDAPYARLQEHLSIYLDAHWGDRASRPPADALAIAPLAAKVAERASAPVELAVELGCSAGRVVAELARGAEHVVGLDLHFGALRRARKLLRGEALVYNRRQVGRHYSQERVAAAELAVSDDRITWLCGDALDPPLLPGQYDRVVAFNLLDSVRQPRQLLAVLDGLCAPGGELLVSSPYAWQSEVVEEGGRLGGEDPARWLRELLESGRDLAAPYQIEDEDELGWTLRKDARASVSYRVHYLRARKGALAAS